jgi:succinoglycan biosynthesis transport protein ExoP
MDLRYYWSILWRRKGIITLTILVAMAIALMASFLIPPTYAATTTLRIATTYTGQTFDQRYDLQYTDRLVNTYAKLAMSAPILSQLAQNLGISRLPAVSVDVPANTELMRLSVEDGDPNRAANGANLLAKILIADFQTHYAQGGQSALGTLSNQVNQAASDLSQARQKLTALQSKSPQDAQAIAAAQTDADVKQQLYSSLLSEYEQARVQSATQANSISIIEPALPPTQPARPNKLLNLGLGFLVGIVGGVGLAFLFENLDTTLFTTEQIEEATGGRIVGRIPVLKFRRGARLNNGLPVAEAFLRLRTNLNHLDHADSVPQKLMVTSAQPSEGKSTVAVNLARALAQSGKSVILVDADLRAPVLHRTFDLPNAKGLSTILQRRISLDEAIQHSKMPRVFVLTSGPLPSNPNELLGSQEMKSLMEQLVHLFGVVVLDTPPYLPVTDAAVLGPMVDGVLLVVARGQSRREAVEETCEQMANQGIRTPGIVVNRAEQDSLYDAYYAHAYGSNDHVEMRGGR